MKKQIYIKIDTNIYDEKSNSRRHITKSIRTTKREAHQHHGHPKKAVQRTRKDEKRNFPFIPLVPLDPLLGGPEAIKRPSPQ